MMGCRSRRSPGSKDWLGRPIEAVVGAVTKCGTNASSSCATSGGGAAEGCSC